MCHLFVCSLAIFLCNSFLLLQVRIGDGTVIGGYLNYPLIKGKKYNYEVYTIWNVTGAPLVGRLRGELGDRRGESLMGEM